MELTDKEIFDLHKEFSDRLKLKIFSSKFKGGAIKHPIKEGICCNIKQDGLPGSLKTDCPKWPTCKGDCFQYNF